MFSELTAGDRWLYSVLSSDPTVQGYLGNPARVFAEDAPAAADFPYVILKLQAAQQDSYAMGNIRVLSTADFIVEAVGMGQTPDFIALEPLVSQIDTLLHGQSGSNVSGIIAQCVRLRPWRYREIDDEGRHYAHLGGVYRLIIQGTES